MFWNGEHLEFIEDLAAKGRLAASQQQPQLDMDGQDLWQMYCFIGDDILISMDVYEKRIGIPPDWEFEECILLVSAMKKRTLELRKLKQDDGRDQHPKH